MIDRKSLFGAAWVSALASLEAAEDASIVQAEEAKERAMALKFKNVRKIALSLENVEEGLSYGTPAFKAGGKLLARLREDGDSLVVGTTFEEREEMMAADPETYYITDHYLNYPWVLVRLSRVKSDEMRDLLGRALRLASGKSRGATAKRKADSSRRGCRE